MRAKKTLPQKYKVGIYIRVSTEEQAENPEGSIKNQEQRLIDYVKLKNADGPWGEIVEIFNDPGISAKDMNRPALRRMLAMIQREEINLVLVTEISRLTRSTKDFANLWDFLKDNNCQFQSLRDNFDTTTPAGEMILFTLANFAQFERKQLGERISNAFQARAKRGLWNGGGLPLGFDLHPEKPGHLIVVEKEAEIVKEAFRTFLQEESIARAGKSLNDRGIKLPMKPRKGGTFRHVHFTIQALYRLLTNRAYIGKRVFEGKDGVKEVDATWEPMIDETVFDRVQMLLAKNKSAKKPPSVTRFPYVLAGLVICKTCGDRMCGKSAHGNGGKIGYYEHTWSTKTQSCLSKKVFDCQPHRILAKRIEPVVWQDVKRLICSENYARELFEEASRLGGQTSLKAELDKMRAKISSLEKQIEATTERISELPKGINAQPFYDQILRLQNAKDDLEREHEETKGKEFERDEPLDLTDFNAFATSLRDLITATTDPELQASICRKVIQKIEVSPIGITIHYHVGKMHFMGLIEAEKKVLIHKDREQRHKKSPVGKNPAGPFYISKPLEKYKNREEWRQAVRGSNSLTFGRGRGT